MDLPVTVEAPAKLTLSLRVTGVRDDGYHLVDAVMVSLDLADTLVIGPGDDLVVEAAATGLDVPASDDNLVRRALAAVGRQADVRLVKRIPAGGGLGGRLLRRRRGPALGGGRRPRRGRVARAPTSRSASEGDGPGSPASATSLDPLPFEPATYTLVVPPFGCATPAVYREWDAMGGPTADGPNDLEPAALAGRAPAGRVARPPRRRHRRDAGAGRQRQHLVRPRCLPRRRPHRRLDRPAAS